MQEKSTNSPISSTNGNRTKRTPPQPTNASKTDPIGKQRNPARPPDEPGTPHRRKESQLTREPARREKKAQPHHKQQKKSGEGPRNNTMKNTAADVRPIGVQGAIACPRERRRRRAPSRATADHFKMGLRSTR